MNGDSVKIRFGNAKKTTVFVLFAFILAKQFNVL